MNAATRSATVAVFYDFENIHATCYDLLHGNGSYKSALGNKFAMKQTDERVVTSIIGFRKSIEKQLGTIALQRGYANWSRFRAYNADMAAALVEQVYVPSQSGSKNSADIWLAADAMELACDRPELTHFVIVSCDGDFSRIAQKLRARGKTVIGVGVEGASINPLWKASCSLFAELPRPAAPCAPRAKFARTSSPARPLSAPMYSTPPAMPVPEIVVAVEPAVPTSAPAPISQESDSNADLAGVVAEYRESLERSQIFLFHSASRREIFTQLARAFSLGGPRPQAIGGMQPLDDFLSQHLADRSHCTLPITRVRQSIATAWLLTKANGRWCLATPADPEALEAGYVRAVLVRLRTKLGQLPNLSAVGRLLYPDSATPTERLNRYAAEADALGASRLFTPEERIAIVCGRTATPVAPVPESSQEVLPAEPIVVEPTAHTRQLATDYRQSLEVSQMFLFDARHRAAVFAKLAAGFANPVRFPLPQADTKSLDAYLNRVLSELHLHPLELVRSRQSISSAWFLSRNGGHWNLIPAPELEALEAGFARAVFVRLRAKYHRDPNVAAVRELLYQHRPPTETQTIADELERYATEVAALGEIAIPSQEGRTAIICGHPLPPTTRNVEHAA